MIARRVYYEGRVQGVGFRSSVRRIASGFDVTGWVINLPDGRVELDNNSVERAIRPQTITRKNALFAGSEAGGQTWATIASLLATARLNEVDPTAWLTQTLERIAAGWPNKNIDALLPWNFSRG